MNTESLLNLARELECRVSYNEPMSAHTTFRVGGNCTAMVEISSAESLAQLINAATNLNVRTIVLGKGSNILFDDKGFNGVIFLLGNSYDDISLTGDNIITAQSGCSLIKLCRFALEHNLSGLEFAYGIPGTVGGAVYMNAGAYGGEIKDIICEATSIRPDGSLHKMDLRALDLSYRHSCFQTNNEVISTATFKLTAGNYDDIQDKMVELMGRRKDKQPLDFPSAGSTFKRPPNQFAGKLIQDCGLSGYSVGGAEVSTKHCGFVISKGNATCNDIMTLIKEVQKIVQEKTGYFLECEVKYIPYEE